MIKGTGLKHIFYQKEETSSGNGFGGMERVITFFNQTQNENINSIKTSISVLIFLYVAYNRN